MKCSATVAVLAISFLPSSAYVHAAAVLFAVLEAVLVLLELVQLDVMEDLGTEPIVGAIGIIKLHLVVFVHVLLHPWMSSNLLSK